MPRSEADKLETEKRIFKVQGWIVEGVQSSLIVKQILDSGWCTSTRQAERYLKSARDRWINIEEGTVEEKRKMKIQELKQLIRGLKEQYKGTPKGIAAVMSVQKEIIKLEALAPARKIELTGEGGGPVKVVSASLTLDEIKQFDKALEDDY